MVDVCKCGSKTKPAVSFGIAGVECCGCGRRDFPIEHHEFLRRKRAEATLETTETARNRRHHENDEGKRKGRFS